MRGKDSENIIEIERERERITAEIPGETDKAVSFIEDIVYMAAYCNAMLTFLPILGSPQGKSKACWGICLVDQMDQCSCQARE